MIAAGPAAGRTIGYWYHHQVSDEKFITREEDEARVRVVRYNWLERDDMWNGERLNSFTMSASLPVHKVGRVSVVPSGTLVDVVDAVVGDGSGNVVPA